MAPDDVIARQRQQNEGQTDHAWCIGADGGQGATRRKRIRCRFIKGTFQTQRVSTVIQARTTPDFAESCHQVGPKAYNE